MFVESQRCIKIILASLILLHQVDAKTTRLTATATRETRDFYVYQIADSSGLSNNIIIDTIGPDDLLEVEVRTWKVIPEVDCKNGGDIKLYSGGSPPVGYYVGSTCGGLPWAWFASSHDTVVISFNYTAIQDVDRVSLRFNIQKDCGVAVTVEDFPVYIRSPNYPNQVPAKYKYCGWPVHAKSGKRVQFSIKFYQPEMFDCTRTNITFIDGSSLRFYRRYIHSWCGEEPSKFISWENLAAVAGHGMDQLYVGFEVKITAVSGPRCEYTIDGDDKSTGVISNPSFPNPFPDLQECRWVIRSSERKVIRVTVLDSNMAGGKDCDVDSVEIYLTSRALDGVRDKWCNGFLHTYEYYTSVLLLIFKSDGLKTIDFNGFRATYEVTETPLCSETLTSTSEYQQITSPNYPKIYPGNKKCVWTISTNDDLMVVEFNVIYADLPYVCGDDDRVSVYDGKTEDESKRLGTICGSSRPEYRSLSSSMTVVFISLDTDYRRKGFKAKYRTGLCGGKHTVGSYDSVVYSPGYPQHYKSGYNCFWNISSSWGAMGFRFTDLDIRCPDDYIMVYDGKFLTDWSTVNDKQKIWKICGRTPQSFFTENLIVHINLHTSTAAGKGFNLTYRGYYTEFEGCRDYVFALYPNKTYQAYHSPGFPEHYFDRLKCRYSLSSFYKIQVTIHIRGIVYSSSSCDGDYLRVFDGKQPTDSILYNKLCMRGNTTVTSTGRHMYIEFHSDAERTGLGYIIYYRTVGEKIYDPDKPEVVSTGLGATSTTLIITLSIIGPAVFVFVCSMVIVCYVKCKGQGGMSRSERGRQGEGWHYDNGDAIRARLEQYGASDTETSESRYVPSTPFTEPSSPSAPPPSYADISALAPHETVLPPSAPPEPRGDNSEPEAPPSYADVSALSPPEPTAQSAPRGDNSEPEAPPSYADVSALSPPVSPPPPIVSSDQSGGNSFPLVPPPSYNQAMEGNMELDSQTFV